MRKIFSLDRFEGEIAVCISDDDEKFDVPRTSLGALELHDVFSAQIDGESLVDIIPMPEERDRRIAENKARLARLFGRGKNG